MIVSLSIVGAITGLASNIIGNAMGSYWKIAAGLLLLFFGLLTLNILPFKIPSFNAGKIKTGSGLLGAFIFGLAIVLFFTDFLICRQILLLEVCNLTR